MLLTGAAGMLGSAVRRRWQQHGGDHRLVAVGRADADLRDAAAVDALIDRVRPDVVVHAAARVGGIAANVADRAGFLYDNLRIDTNVIGASRAHGVEEFVYVGSSCMYPRDHRQPLVETDLLAGPLEPTNDGYALAKIAGAELCRLLSAQHDIAYRVLVPSNLYGPGDDFTPGRAHLVAATLAKADAAERAGEADMLVWGDGEARREFTYVDDVADFVLRVLPRLHELPPMLNVGAGEDHSVTEYHRMAAEVVGFTGGLVFDTTRPVGMHQKLMDSSLARTHGWEPLTSLADGMRRTYDDYLRRNR